MIVSIVSPQGKVLWQSSPSALVTNLIGNSILQENKQGVFVATDQSYTAMWLTHDKPTLYFIAILPFSSQCNSSITKLLETTKSKFVEKYFGFVEKNTKIVGYQFENYSEFSAVFSATLFDKSRCNPQMKFQSSNGGFRKQNCTTDQKIVSALSNLSRTLQTELFTSQILPLSESVKQEILAFLIELRKAPNLANDLLLIALSNPTRYFDPSKQKRFNSTEDFLLQIVRCLVVPWLSEVMCLGEGETDLIDEQVLEVFKLSYDIGFNLVTLSVVLKCIDFSDLDGESPSTIDDPLLEVIELLKIIKIGSIDYLYLMELLDECNRIHIYELSNVLQLKLLQEILHSGLPNRASQDQLCLVQEHLIRLCEAGFKFKNLMKICSYVDKGLSFERRMDLLEAMYLYNLNDSNSPDIIKVLQEHPPEAWCLQLLRFSFGTRFSSTNSEDRHTADLLTELTRMNPSFNLGSKRYETILKSVTKLIEEMRESNFQQILKKKGNATLIEAMAAASYALFLASGKVIKPKPSQLLAVLLFADKRVFPSGFGSIGKNKGRLAQVNTGEGKTFIVALLAGTIILASQELLGKQKTVVDIVTSSPVLAMREANSPLLREYYKRLNISLACNCSQELEAREKVCYQSDVVYGDTSSYQFDYLGNLFQSNKQLRGKRVFGVVIVDEVDSMFIDQGSHSTMVASQIPGFEHLEPLLISLLFRGKMVLRHFVEVNDNIFFIDRLSDTPLAEFLAKSEKGDDGESSANTTNITSSAQVVPVGEYVKLLQQTGVKNNVRYYVFSQEREGAAISLAKWCAGGLGVSAECEEYSEVFLLYNPECRAAESPPVQQWALMNLFESSEQVCNAVKEELSNFIDEVLKDHEGSSTEKKFYIPKHLVEFVNTQKERWIESAFVALNVYKEKQHYLITRPKGTQSHASISPVDYDNTGILQQNTQWPDGLHQFLQILNNLHITPETLVTNYLSNFSFFSTYECVFGLTGTLGSHHARDLLTRIYEVDWIDVPSSRGKRVMEYRGILAKDAEKWKTLVVSNAVREATNGRSVLVICESEGDAEAIAGAITGKVPVQHYCIETLDSLSELRLRAGEVMVATNLGARGTDIEILEYDKMVAGLHVIVTYVPRNLRVEQQASGRTGRQGRAGTWQVIAYLQSTSVQSILSGCGDDDDDDELSRVDITVAIRRQRDKQEKYLLQDCEENEIPKIKALHEIFQQLGKIKMNYEKETSSVTLIDAYVERWGLWLKVIDSQVDKKQLAVDQVTLKYKEFAEILVKESKYPKDLLRNPYYATLYGIELNKASEYEEAKQVFCKAIESDEVFSYNAHYNIAYTYLKLDKRDDAKTHLNQCKKIIEEKLIIQWSGMMAYFGLSFNDEGNVVKDAPNTENKESTTEDSDIVKQLVGRMNALQIQIQVISDCLAKLEELESKDITVRLENVDPEQGKDTSWEAMLEACDSGFQGKIVVEEDKTGFWLGVFAVMILGAIQVVAGAALCVLSVGALASFGSGLIGEGIGDIVFSCCAIQSGEFSWKSYWIDKGISLAIWAATAGVGAAISRFSKTAITVGTKVASASSKIGKAMSKVVAVGKKVISYGKKAVSYVKSKISSMIKWVKQTKFGQFASRFVSFHFSISD